MVYIVVHIEVQLVGPSSFLPDHGSHRSTKKCIWQELAFFGHILVHISSRLFQVNLFEFGVIGPAHVFTAISRLQVPTRNYLPFYSLSYIKLKSLMACPSPHDIVCIASTFQTMVRSLGLQHDLSWGGHLTSLR